MALPIAGLTALVGIVAGVACGNSTDTTTPDLFVTPFGLCGQASTYALLTASQASLYCPSSGCSGATYAFCDGASWAACGCAIPSGWTTFMGTPTFGSAQDGAADTSMMGGSPTGGSRSSSGSSGRGGSGGMDSAAGGSKDGAGGGDSSHGGSDGSMAGGG
jgi:hypothetical protein